jgi:hypothetical protein
MAMLFWFCVVAATLDCWNFACQTASLIQPDIVRARVARRPALYAVFAAVLLLSVWGLREARALRVREVRVTAPGWPAARRPVRLVQISDLHLCVHRGGAALNWICETVPSLQPDLIVATGDIVDSPRRNIRAMLDQLAAMPAPLGKYSVMGNHEFYLGLEESIRCHEAAGFTVLRQAQTNVADGLTLAGVDDLAGWRITRYSRMDEARLFAGPPSRDYVVLLKHQPRVTDIALLHCDLQLSGHIHDGQIFPFQWLVRLWYRHPSGLHRLGERLQLYVNRGAGTWGPPMRFLAPPEIALIEIGPAHL